MSSSRALAPTKTHPPPQAAAPIYPPITHPLSPTYFTWVKLTAHEIHHVLKPAPRNFASLSYSLNPLDHPAQPTLYHYINHPVQYVYLVGVVVQVDEYNVKYYIFVLDDGSGETVEVVCPRPVGMTADPVSGSVIAGQPAATSTKLDAEEVEMHQLLSTLTVGTALKVKGHITTFRSYRQVRLDRVSLVKDTNEEAKFWASMRIFHDTVLTKPWVLSEQDIARAKVEANKKVEEQEAQVARRRERAKARVRIEEEQRRKLERRWEREERIREREAEKARKEGEEVTRIVRERRQRRETTSGSNGNVLEDGGAGGRAKSKKVGS